MRTQHEDESRNRGRVGAAAGVAVGLVGGAAAGLMLGVPGVSGASDAPAAVVQQDDDEAPETDDDAEPGHSFERGDRLRDGLEPLVEDGTITSGQADAVAEHLVEQRPEGRMQRHGSGKHGRFGGPVARGAISDAVTELLGIDAETVRDELRSGSTLAELAEANGVPTETLVDTLVAQASQRLDVAVENGRIDADKAADFEEKLEEQMTERVNGEFSRRDRFGPRD
jgi:hypothetical protein